MKAVVAFLCFGFAVAAFAQQKVRPRAVTVAGKASICLRTSRNEL